MTDRASRPSCTSLVGDERGATIIEFAIVVPVMLTLILGFADLTYQGYVQSVLSGVMQKAGRDSTIEGNGAQSQMDAIDNKVKQAILPLAKTATFTSTRKSYAQFGNVAPEPFDDNNHNGSYDAALECYTDLNGNKTWDADPGATGQGGASDVVVYTMTVTYNRVFPVAKLLGWSPQAMLSATTVLRNQPYKQQVSYSPTKICP